MTLDISYYSSIQSSLAQRFNVKYNMPYSKGRESVLDYIETGHLTNSVSSVLSTIVQDMQNRKKFIISYLII